MSCGKEKKDVFGRPIDGAGAGAGATANAIVAPSVGNVARTIARGNEQADELLLKKGSYKVVSRVPFNGLSPVFLQDMKKGVEIDGQIKRVYFHKIELDQIAEPEPGYKTARQTIEYTLLDNPVPVRPVVDSATVLAVGSTQDGAKIEQVQEFNDFNLSEIAITAGAVASFIFAVWQLTK